MEVVSLALQVVVGVYWPPPSSARTCGGEGEKEMLRIYEDDFS